MHDPKLCFHRVIVFLFLKLRTPFGRSPASSLGTCAGGVGKQRGDRSRSKTALPDEAGDKVHHREGRPVAADLPSPGNN